MWSGVVLLLSIPVLLITERRHLGGRNVCIRTDCTYNNYNKASGVLRYSWATGVLVPHSPTQSQYTNCQDSL